MRLQFFIPGLLWPGLQTRAPCQGLDAPALERLLGLQPAALGPPRNSDAALVERFRLPHDTAPAALRRLGETGQAPGGPCLCVDPVGLRFTRDHLLLIDGAELDIAPAEATALIDGLNDTFPEIGRFVAGSPSHWYLEQATPPQVRLVPLADVVGRPVAMFMPEGEDARHWHRLINETQVWLHAHPVNQARDAAGRQTINSLWPWGNGSALTTATAPAPRLVGVSPLLAGLARAAGSATEAAPLDTLLQDGRDALVCLGEAELAARHMDLGAWQAALADIDRQWLAPALAALRDARLQGISLTAPGDRATLQLELERPRLWPFWKRPQPLQTLIERQQ